MVPDAKGKEEMKKRKKQQKEPRMLRAGISPKRAIELFDRTFKYANQHPPYMKAYEADPSVSFMLEAYSLISRWQTGVMRALLRSLTKVDPAPDVAGLIGQTKRLLHEVLDDKDINKKDGRTQFARWRAWPHIRVTADKFVDSTRSKELTDEEREEMSKAATKKKVVSVKKAASTKKTPAKTPAKASAKPAKKSSLVDMTTKLRVVANSKKPA